jgi:DNA polymerase III delta subunit
VGEAVGDRDLPRALRALDEELWTMKTDKARSVIGLLYGLISKVRALLFVKEMLRAGWLKPDMGTDRIKTALERIPADVFPADRKLNPAAIHPFVLYKCIPQTAHYTLEELVRGMELLLQANLRIVTTGADETLVLQQTLVELMGTAKPKRTGGGAAYPRRAGR